MITTLTNQDFNLLRRIVLEVASALQDAADDNNFKPITAESWAGIADELDRARSIAATEAERLYDLEA